MRYSVLVAYSKAAMHQTIAKCQQDGSYTHKKRPKDHKSLLREDHIMRRTVTGMRPPTSSKKKIRTDLFRRSHPVSCMFMLKRLFKESNLKSYKPAKNCFIELVGDLIPVTILLIMWSSCAVVICGLPFFFPIGIGAILLTLCNCLVHCFFTRL